MNDDSLIKIAGILNTLSTIWAKAGPYTKYPLQVALWAVTKPTPKHSQKSTLLATLNAKLPSGRTFSLGKTALLGLLALGGYHGYKNIRSALQDYAKAEKIPIPDLAKAIDTYTKYRQAVSELYPMLNPALGAIVGGIGGLATAELMDKSPTAGLIVGALLGGGLGQYLNTRLPMQQQAPAQVSGK